MKTPLNNYAEQLIQAACQAYERAYAPYSNYQVGAAVLTSDGQIFTGCNVENAVYPLTLCAERVAITKAISEGASHLNALAVVTRNGGTPCGACRQVMCEFGAPDMLVLISDINGKYRQYTLEQLLPESFSATDLDHSRTSVADIPHCPSADLRAGSSE